MPPRLHLRITVYGCHTLSAMSSSIERLTRRAGGIINRARFESMVKPGGKGRREVISFRLYPEFVATVDFFARERNLSRSDAVRHLLVKGLESEGW